MSVCNIQTVVLSGIVTWSAATSGSAYAVPEPETHAMLLAGLELMGAVARHKVKAKHNGASDARHH